MQQSMEEQFWDIHTQFGINALIIIGVLVFIWLCIWGYIKYLEWRD